MAFSACMFCELLQQKRANGRALAVGERDAKRRGGGGMHQLHENKLVFLAASASAACVL
jgi:hypothetical protein